MDQDVMSDHSACEGSPEVAKGAFAQQRNKIRCCFIQETLSPTAFALPVLPVLKYLCLQVILEFSLL